MKKLFPRGYVLLGVAVKLVKLGIAALLLSGAAQAVNLGGSRVLSQAGEPLRAEVGLTGMTPADVGNVRAALASPDIFAASGMDYPPVLDTVRITVIKNGENFSLRLTTEQPVTDAMLTPIIELTTKDGTQLKSVSLAIPGGRTPAPVPPAAAAAAVPPGAATPPWPVPSPGAASAPAKAPSVAPAPAPVAPVPAPAPVSKAAPAPVTTAAVAATVTEAIRQELRQQMGGANDSEALRKQLSEAQTKIDALGGVLTKMEALVTAQQKIIDAQAGVVPAPDGPAAGAAAPTAGAPAAAVAATGSPPAVIERESIDPDTLLLAAGGGALVGVPLFLLLFLWERRRKQGPVTPAVNP